MNGDAIFLRLVLASDLRAAIAQLPMRQLAVLLGHLDGSTGGVRALVLGAAQIEAAKRFTRHFLA